MNKNDNVRTKFRNLYKFRIAFVLIAFAAAFGALGRHFYRLQIVRHEELHDKARSLYTTSVVRRGRRGSIFDRNGNLLVGNRAYKDIFAEPRRMPAEQQPYVIYCLAQQLDVAAATLRRRFNSGLVEVVVAKQVDIKDAAAIRELKLPGLRFVDSENRSYPKRKLLANVLGFTYADGRGAYGLEAVLDSVLAPRQGRVVFEQDRKGQKIHRGSPEAYQPLDGGSVYLTIEEPIQHIVEQELRAMVDKFVPRHAYAVMANPKTGAIMALAQLPSYNPNNRTKMDPARWRNRLASDVYDPGSTMKCIAIAGALDYGVVSLDSIFDCEYGSWFYAGRPLRDSGHSYGQLEVREIIQKSSNIGAAKIAIAMGERRLYQTLRRFGFGERTGVGLPDESPGLLRKLPDWDGLSITRFPIGQGISVTALQLVQSYAAIANGGYMMQFQLLDRVVEGSSGKVVNYPPMGKHRVIRKSTANAMISAMVLVTMEGGTATKAAVSGYFVAGKTGTSQKLVDGSYTGHGQYVASFIGFVPATDPAFVLLVVADAPSAGKYYGGTVAAPTFSRISEKVLRYLAVPPDMPGMDGSFSRQMASAQSRTED